MKITDGSSNDNWREIDIWLDSHEIELLIKNLTKLKNDNRQHFHITRNSNCESCLDQITFSIIPANYKHNMSCGSIAYEAGSELNELEYNA